jgi:hypothetical protein
MICGALKCNHKLTKCGRLWASGFMSPVWRSETVHIRHIGSDRTSCGVAFGFHPRCINKPHFYRYHIGRSVLIPHNQRAHHNDNEFIMYVLFSSLEWNSDLMLPVECTLSTCKTMLIRPLRCSACRIACYCVR